MWHVVWSCSTFLPSIIKIFQRVFDLQSRHEINGLSLSNITKGDNTKSKKDIPVHDMLSGPVLHFCKVSSKYSKGYSSYRTDTKSFSNKTKGDYSKSKKGRLSFLYVTCRLVLLYISTKYHQNIPKGIQVIEQTRSFTPTPTGSIPKTICPPHPPPLVLGRGITTQTWKHLPTSHYMPHKGKNLLLKGANFFH